MKRAKSINEVDASILYPYKNETLIVEQSRRSMMTSEQKETVNKVAFEGGYDFYDKEYLISMLRTQRYQINFQQEILHQMFCRGHGLIQEHYDLYAKGNEHVKELVQSFQDILDFQWHLGNHSSELEKMFHDESKGGWHHEKTVNDWKPTVNNV